ncbi:hypothetical protein QAD02_005612 [Eretmocerus hayati]|uniref:Uncharacterized protein n=1 Tax=Eretmocerus hayati TaxID=131215 RepID=A0ACC2NST2_9HYME|nr:hypothetical protein QAD02_005612 [Eretmocerus hayati]
MAQKNFGTASLVLFFVVAYVISSAHSEFSKKKSRFISFDSSSGNIDIDLDLSVPFLSIPLDEKKGNGQMQMPFVNINTKALGVFASLMAISAFIIPLFVKKSSGLQPKPAGLHQYRSDQDSSYFEHFSKDIFHKDGRFTPCLQSIICSAVATAIASNEPTSVDKIIDGIASFRWFENAINGSVVNDAVAMGRRVSGSGECATKYDGCSLIQELVPTILNIVGV